MRVRRHATSGPEESSLGAPPSTDAPKLHGIGAKRTGGFLIVNADDWGLRTSVTDAVLACVRAKRVTSISAMVYMADSDRAADLALSERIPTGLHLNLDLPFTALDVPENVRSPQAILARYFRGASFRRWLYNPRIQTIFDVCIRDQLKRFRDLYGNQPTHIDGHHHLHTAPNVIFSHSLMAGSTLRRTFSFEGADRRLAKRSALGLLNHLIARRFVTPDYLVALDPPALVRTRAIAAKVLSENAIVEVMAHAQDQPQREVMLSAGWSEFLKEYPLGSFADLEVRGR